MLLSFFGEDCDVRGLTEQDQLAFTRKRLDQNPLAGVRRPREKNPKRPVAGWERYQETRRILQDLIANAKAELSRLKWLKLDLALTLAEATGRRLGAIRQLKWEDIDFSRSTIRWRAETDKKGKGVHRSDPGRTV